MTLLVSKRISEDTDLLPPKRRREDPKENTLSEGQTCQETASTQILQKDSGVDAGDVGLQISALPAHPEGIKPLGNLYSASVPNLKSHSGSLARLPDELLIHVFEQLSARDLLHVGATSKALHAFARHDELWKVLVVESPLAVVKEGQKLNWYGSWRATYLRLSEDRQSRVDCTNLYSDTLYRPFHCAHLPLELYADPSRFHTRIPKLVNLAPEEFQAQWTDRPFILTETVSSWRVCHDWDLSSLRSRFGSKIFRCEAVDWPMETYVQYMTSNTDESPLYLFDSNFVEKMQLRVSDGSNKDREEQTEVDFTPPHTFSPDLFTVFAEERPSHRWLIMGPPRSGSSFHTDPNGTSAWNAVLKGRKYWIMSPTPPPGVFVSDDESEVTSPSSIAEWLLGFHEEARRRPDVCEGICEEGEVLHVPGGWYHLVLNLPSINGSNADNIAITQNFVPEPRLPKVLRFLRDKPDQVSGFRSNDDAQLPAHRPQVTHFNAYDLFVSRLQEQYPNILAAALGKVSEEENADSVRKAKAWDKVVQEKERGAAAFSFGFSLEELSDEDVS